GCWGGCSLMVSCTSMPRRRGSREVPRHDEGGEGGLARGERSPIAIDAQGGERGGGEFGVKAGEGVRVAAADELERQVLQGGVVPDDHHRGHGRRQSAQPVEK